MAEQPEQVQELLQEFKRNNPHCRITLEGEKVVIDSPWGFNANRLTYVTTEMDVIQDLNHIVMHPQFDAILHVDSNIIEFIMGHLSPTDDTTKEYIDRKFDFHFDGARYDCFFAEPTQRTYQLAKHLSYLPNVKGIRVVPQMREFRDILRLDSLPETAKGYFEGKVARNFFIKPSITIARVDLPSLARHLNFVTDYYDRRAPFINIRDEEANQEPERVRPLRFIQGTFPPSLVLCPIDDIALRFIEVARGSQYNRFAFLYYYQVLEYYGFHFMEYKTTNAIRKLLRDPAIVSCPGDRPEEFFSIMSELKLSDDEKIQKVISECCDPRVLWKEIIPHKETLARKTSFDGGFQLNPLISEDTTEDAWRSSWGQVLPSQFREIRNHLVHARERRQSRVILPTQNNDRLIAKYVFLIARVCEQVAIYNA